LVSKINGLKKELLVSYIECLLLKDDLQATREKLLSIESSSVNNSDVIVTLNAELEKSKVVRQSLRSRLHLLRRNWR
jgi:hypothetical protein